MVGDTPQTLFEAYTQLQLSKGKTLSRSPWHGHGLRELPCLRVADAGIVFPVERIKLLQARLCCLPVNNDHLTNQAPAAAQKRGVISRQLLLRI